MTDDKKPLDGEIIAPGDEITFKPKSRPLNTKKSRAASKSKSLKQTSAKRGDYLPPKHQAFFDAYIANVYSGVKAFEKTWPDFKGSDYTKNNKIRMLTKHPAFQMQLEKHKQAHDKKIEIIAHKHAITKERIIAELGRIAFADVRSVLSWDDDGVIIKASEDVDDDSAAAISEITMTSSQHGKNVKVKMADKQAALVNLGKHLGMFKDETTHQAQTAVFIIEK